jgi:hypothetical protein
MIGAKLIAWNEMLPLIANITLTQEPDEFAGTYFVVVSYQ